jgi:hypothetical protein
VNKREKYLVLFMSLALVGGIGFGLYTLVWEPLTLTKAQIRATEKDVDELNSANRDMEVRLKKFADLNKRSLPADFAIARQEYDTALTRIMRESKITGYTIKDFSEPPRENEKNKPPYQKLQFTITVSKVDIASLANFMERYYKLNLLHHLVSFSIRRTDSVTSSGKKDSLDARRDLEVTLKSEAIILEGADKKTLHYIPEAQGVALGAAGYFGLKNSRTVARGIRPQEIERILAIPDRDYAVLTWHDILHGPVPPPPLPTPKVVKEEPPPPKKPGIDPYIKFTTLIRQSTGTALISLKDIANNYDYDINFVQKGSKLDIVVTKLEYYSSGGIRDKTKSTTGMLAISDKTSSTNRNFKVYGIDGNALVLGERDGPEIAKATQPGGFRPGGGRPPVGGSRTPLPPPDPKQAVLGGVVVVGPKPEKYFTWEIGQPLSRIKELKYVDGVKAVQRAALGLTELASTTIPTPPPQPLEIAPMPKLLPPERN